VARIVFMYCTRCGTQAEQGKKFCKNCGASLAKTAAPVAGDREPGSGTSSRPTERPTTAVDGTQALPISPARESRGINRAVFAAAGVAALVAISAGVYFATGLFRGKAGQESSPGARETIAGVSKSPDASFLETPKTEDSGPDARSADSDFTPPLWSKEAESPPPKVAEAPTVPSESKPRPAPRQSPATTARKAPSQPPASADRAPAPAKAVRPGATPGTYQTVRSTPVHESPSTTSRVVARIDDGIRVNVVGSTGEWLEVRSRTGNPPGFIRRDDAVRLE
jgi:hypothetical protein